MRVIKSPKYKHQLLTLSYRERLGHPPTTTAASKFDEVKQKLRRESFHREPLRDDTDGGGNVQQSYQQKAATMDETRSSSLAEKLGQLIVGSNSPRQQRSR